MSWPLPTLSHQHCACQFSLTIWSYWNISFSCCAFVFSMFFPSYLLGKLLLILKLSQDVCSSWMPSVTCWTRHVFSFFFSYMLLCLRHGLFIFFYVTLSLSFSHSLTKPLNHRNALFSASFFFLYLLQCTICQTVLKMIEWFLIFLPIDLIIHESMGFFFLYLEFILKTICSSTVVNLGKMNF